MLISSPAKAWDEIGTEEDRRKVMPAFVYPMIAFCGLSTFVGSLLGIGISAQAFQIALTNSCAVFVALFGSYFLVAYLANKYGTKVLGRPNESALCLQFVGHSMTVIFVLSFITGLFPSFLILQLMLQLYVVYIVWEGARHLMHVPDKNLMMYTIFISFSLIVAPMVIRWIFNRLLFQ